MTTLYDCLRQESLAIIEAAEKLNDIEVQKAINILISIGKNQVFQQLELVM